MAWWAWSARHARYRACMMLLARFESRLLSLAKQKTRQPKKKKKKKPLVMQATLAGDEIGPPALLPEITMPCASQ